MVANIYGLFAVVRISKMNDTNRPEPFPAVLTPLATEPAMVVNRLPNLL